MSKRKNYNKMYAPGSVDTEVNTTLVNDIEEQFPVEETVVDEYDVVEAVVAEEFKVEDVGAEESTVKVGVIVKCDRLNVREEPKATASVLGILTKNSEVRIVEDIKNAEWAHVCTATGLDGFCMKQYIDVKE